MVPAAVSLMSSGSFQTVSLLFTPPVNKDEANSVKKVLSDQGYKDFNQTIFSYGS